MTAERRSEADILITVTPAQYQRLHIVDTTTMGTATPTRRAEAVTGCRARTTERGVALALRPGRGLSGVALRFEAGLGRCRDAREPSLREVSRTGRSSIQHVQRSRPPAWIEGAW